MHSGRRHPTGFTGTAVGEHGLERVPDLALTSADPTEGEVTVSTSEKIKARAEQLVGKAVRKTAHAVGNKTTEAKGAALEARGKARAVKEHGKDYFAH